jgi:hypothetical protein
VIERRGTQRRAALVGALAVGVLVSAACSGDDRPDPAAAAERLSADKGWTAKEARCAVNRLVDELGDAAIEPPAPVAGVDPELLAGIAVDCVDPARLVASGLDTTSLTVAPGEPAVYGDDPALDALWDACAFGDGVACDDLFHSAPLGSDYEQFGNSCGGRGYQPSCAGPDPTASSIPGAPSPTTTLPPPPPPAGDTPPSDAPPA